MVKSKKPSRAQLEKALEQAREQLEAPVFVRFVRSGRVPGGPRIAAGQVVKNPPLAYLEAVPHVRVADAYADALSREAQGGVIITTRHERTPAVERTLKRTQVAQAKLEGAGVVRKVAETGEVIADSAVERVKRRAVRRG